MTYDRMVGNQNECDRLIIKWQPVLNYTSEGVPPITDMTAKLQTAIMLERVEGVWHTSKDLKREIPKTRREFPLLSEAERVSMIDELAIETVAAMQGVSNETAKKYLNL
jgi:hypothetical protein